MTDPMLGSGVHTRWLAAALLAPAAAAVFTGATMWTVHRPPAYTAAQQTPLTLSALPSSHPLSRPTADPALAAMHSSVQRDAAKLALLRKTLAALKPAAPTSKATAGGAPPAVSAAAPAGTSVTTNAAPAYTAAAPVTQAGAPAPAYVAPAPVTAVRPPAPAPAPAPVPAPVPVVQPAPAPPPTHTTTGASGAPK